MKTDTPRTNEWLAEEKRNPRLSGLGNWLDYCKQLERELAAVTEQRDRLADALKHVAEGSSCCACRGSAELVSIAEAALQSLTTNEL
jgi:hypothetical protein